MGGLVYPQGQIKTNDIGSLMKEDSKHSESVQGRDKTSERVQ